MSGNFHRVPMGEVATFKTGKLDSNAAVENGAYPFFTCSRDTFRTNTYSFDDEVVLLAGNNANGIYPLKYFKGKFDAYQRTYVIRPIDESRLDTRFLYFALRPQLDHLRSVSTGSATKFLTMGLLSDLELPLPNLPTQRKIAGILSAYDDLIENNLRRIKILEEMAQSLYREWFVHFRFPGHESARFIDSSLGRIPKGWEVRKILDFAEVIYGFSFKANRFNTAGEGVPVVRIRNIQDGKSETYSEEEGDSKHRIKNGDILVGMDGDFHMTIWSGGDAWQNQRVAKFRPKGAMGNYLIFLTLEKPIHYFDSTITGTTVAHLGDSHIKTIEFPSPPEALMRKASDLLEPMAQKQLNLRRRNQALRHTRDLLLPKLLGS